MIGFSSLSDRELLDIAKSGEDDAVSEIVHRFTPLVKSIVASFDTKNIGGSDFDDLFQEGLITLVSSIYTYDEKKETAFSTYAYACVKNRMISFFRKSGHKAEKHIENGEFHDVSRDLSHNALNPENVLVEQESSDEIASAIRHRLSPLEYDVLMLYLKSYSYLEIADNLSIPPKSVDNAIQRIRRKLAPGLLENS